VNSYASSTSDCLVCNLHDSPHAAERALVSLPSPLTVSDGCVLRRGGGNDTLKVTAGIHRQVWVSGTTIFVDVFIANNSYKKVRSLTLQLVRWIGGYKHVCFSQLSTGFSAS
jgi:hypothetical protein